MAMRRRFKPGHLIVCIFAAVVLVASSVPALADDTAASVPEARAELAKKISAIAQLRPFDPKMAARILRARLGPPQKSTEYNTEHKVEGPGALFTGTVVRTPRAISLTIEPAVSMGLAFQDLEPLLLDYPHEVELLQAHFGEVEQRIVAVRHWFQVPAGRLSFEVWAERPASSDEKALISEAYAAARGESNQKSLIKTVSIDDRRVEREDRPPTLRERRTKTRGRK